MEISDGRIFQKWSELQFVCRGCKGKRRIWNGHKFVLSKFSSHKLEKYKPFKIMAKDAVTESIKKVQNLQYFEVIYHCALKYVYK